MKAELKSFHILEPSDSQNLVQGTIFDPNNATVLRAAVTLVHAGSSVERKTVTDGDGHYLFQFLPSVM